MWNLISRGSVLVPTEPWGPWVFTELRSAAAAAAPLWGSHSVETHAEFGRQAATKSPERRSAAAAERGLGHRWAMSMSEEPRNQLNDMRREVKEAAGAPSSISSSVL